MAAVVPAAFACAASAGSPDARADTLIDGGELGGQVWTVEGSPYVVTETNGAPVVSEGSELRIEAGVTVRFVGSATTYLEVTGSLKVLGTPSSPVVMQGASDGVELLWGGVRLLRSVHGASEVRNAVFRNAGYGVQVDESEAQVSQSTFEHCRVGLSVRDSPAAIATDREYAFDSLTFLNNVVGFECDYCRTVKLTNVVARGSSAHAVILHGFGYLTLVNSTLDGGAKGNGLVVWPSTGNAEWMSQVAAVNTIFSNHRTAIEVDLAGGPAVLTATHSTFWGSETANLRVKRSASAPEPRFVDTPASDAPTGAGNVVADPQYVSATDLRLSPGSPCIDSGVADEAPDHDLDQEVRPVDGDGVDGAAVDRGAYEFRVSGAAGNGEGGASGNDSGAAGNGGGGAAASDGGTAGSDGGGAEHGGRAGTGTGGVASGPGSTGGVLASGGTGGVEIGSDGGESAAGNAPTDTAGKGGSPPTPAAGGEHPVGDRGGCGCVLTPRSDATLGPVAVLALVGLLRRYRKRSA